MECSHVNHMLKVFVLFIHQVPQKRRIRAILSLKLRHLQPTQDLEKDHKSQGMTTSDRPFKVTKTVTKMINRLF